MKEIVKIYVLIDPFTLKVRYIGRTIQSLEKRLYDHVYRSKRLRDKSHKEYWIRSLLKVNSKPHIRVLTTVMGWKESHKVEQQLICKYKHRLVNHNDKGEGGLNKIVTEKQKIAISQSLKKHYKSNPHPNSKTVYCYNEDGTFYKEYESSKHASEDLGIYRGTINKHLTGVIKNKYLKNGKQFSYTKVKRMKNHTLKKNRRAVHVSNNMYDKGAKSVKGVIPNTEVTISNKRLIAP